MSTSMMAILKSNDNDHQYKFIKGSSTRVKSEISKFTESLYSTALVCEYDPTKVNPKTMDKILRKIRRH